MPVTTKLLVFPSVFLKMKLFSKFPFCLLFTISNQVCIIFKRKGKKKGGKVGKKGGKGKKKRENGRNIAK